MTESIIEEDESAHETGVEIKWPALPTETEIYILPDGRVMVADLPMELAQLLATLGGVEACELFTSDNDRTLS